MNKHDKRKEFQKAWDEMHGNYFFSALCGQIKVYGLESNNKKAIEFGLTKNSFGHIEIYEDVDCYFYVLKDNKHSKEEWTFIFLVLLTILGFELYKNLDGSLKKEAAIILFASSYVVNNIKGDFRIPSVWAEIEKIVYSVKFKSENAVFSYLEDERDVAQKLYGVNFILSQKESIEKKKHLSMSLSGGRKSFSEIFVDGLLRNAQKTLTLKTKVNLSEEEVEQQKCPAQQAKRWIILNYPLLSALASSFKVIYNIDFCKRNNISIGAVIPSEKIIAINPLAGLNDMGLRFVMAHEVLHVALHHAGRRKGRDHLMWNLACDFVINDWLVDMKVGIAPSGVYLDKDLKGKSADEIYLMLAQDVRLKKKLMTLRDLKAGEKNKAGVGSCDIIGSDESFSDFETACSELLMRGMYMHKDAGRSDLPLGLEDEIKVLNQPAIPWQVELADWIASRFPLEEAKRTYAKASRRQSSTPDIPRPSYVKPEYDKNNRTFGIIMDTSGSMDKSALGKCLGAIASYCQAQEVQEVRLVFCDAQAYDAGYVQVSEIKHKFRICGGGGTVLQQAVNFLENTLDFPNKAPILILTDGFFESKLSIERDHAFLVTNKYNLPFVPGDNVFEFK